MHFEFSGELATNKAWKILWRKFRSRISKKKIACSWFKPPKASHRKPSQMAFFAWHPVKIIYEVVFCFTFSDEVDWWVCCSSNDGSVADKTHLFTWVLLPFQNYFIWSRLFPLLLRMVLRDERYFGAGLSYCSVPRENHVINLKTMWSPKTPRPALAIYSQAAKTKSKCCVCSQSRNDGWMELLKSKTLL